MKYYLNVIYIMSTRSLIARVSTIESNVDTLQSKADSENAVLTGTTSINGPVLLNGAVSFTSTISGIDKSKVGLGNVDNTSDKLKTTIGSNSGNVCNRRRSI